MCSLSPLMITFYVKEISIRGHDTSKHANKTRLHRRAFDFFSCSVQDLPKHILPHWAAKKKDSNFILL